MDGTYEMEIKEIKMELELSALPISFFSLLLFSLSTSLSFSLDLPSTSPTLPSHIPLFASPSLLLSLSLHLPLSHPTSLSSRSYSDRMLSASPFRISTQGSASPALFHSLHPPHIPLPAATHRRHLPLSVSPTTHRPPSLWISLSLPTVVPLVGSSSHNPPTHLRTHFSPATHRPTPQSTSHQRPTAIPLSRSSLTQIQLIKSSGPLHGPNAEEQS